MTVATQLPLTLTSYNNQSLFSDHYLDDILRGDNAWREAIPQAQLFLLWLRDLYAQEKEQLAGYNEAQLEGKWFEPIFERLGHVWQEQTIIPAFKGGIKKPDYVFFPDEDARKTAVSQQNTADYANAALAIGEVKQWDIALDKNQQGAAIFDNKNPMYQIDSYLSLTGVAWGVLSNGRYWRLLHKSSSRTLETYVEIDLLAMLETADDKKAIAIATYFWLFFNQASYTANARGNIFLDDALAASRKYALALEADLRDNAYRALEQLILGFFAANPGLNADEPAHLADVYRNSLYLLYRLLFLFYGESRALLPLDNATYRDEYSLQRLSKKIDHQRNELDKLPATGRRYWSDLSELFRLIGGADVQLNADLGVPRYNGGLFDGQQHPFLEEHRIGDRYVARAIDYLAVRRVMDSGGKPAYHAVDYRTLDVRQLGSIYEGLLEYRVAIAREEMVTVSKKGTETWVPLAKKGKAKIFGNRRQIGDLYLTTDKGERKATGSYYTPDYIVEYIVENTLSPLVAQAEARAMGDGDRFIAEILALNVLDPAMGSGHFLVEATNYLARVLVIGVGGARSQAFIKSLTSESSKSLTSESASDLLYWKRRVVEACIYGVDKNPMAVELAKLSLWLKTAAADKPLSFLDHHLQHGDSLIGATLDDLQTAPTAKAGKQGRGEAEGQKPLIDESAFTRDVGLAVGGVMAIEAMLTETIDDVHAKEEIWESLQRTHIADWRRLADVWVSTFFGNAMSREEYRALADRLQGRDSLMSEAQAERLLNHPAVTDNDYFHWQFMFPEVFFDKHGKPQKEAAGFDAVIGNPPYVRQESFSASKSFLQDAYTVYHSAADLYVYFMELGVRLLKKDAFCGLIVSHKFMRADYGMALRHFLTRQATPQQIVHFGDLPIFDTVSAYPAIIQWQKGIQDDPLPTVLVAQFDEMGFEEDLQTAVNQSNYAVSYVGLQDSGWTLRNGKITQLQQKIIAASIPLHEYVDGQIHYGIKTGFNQAFFIDRATHDKIVKISPQSAPLLKPLATGEDLRRYSINNRGQFMVVIPAGWSREQSGLIEETTVWEWFQNTHQALAAHLAPFAEKARQRYDMGDFWWELRPCAYYAAFDSPKIIYPIIAKTLRFSLDVDRFYGNDKTYIIPKEDTFLLALLNASLTGFFTRFALSGLRGDYLEFRASHFQKLPIYAVAFTTGDDIKTAVFQQSQALYQQADHPALLALVAAELAAGRNDTIHDLLAFLAEEMIRLNKAKQTETDGFLDWLADYTELPLNEWKLKTIARAYYDKGWEAFRRALKQNKSKITAVDVNGRVALNKIKGEYEASVNKLAAPLAAITTTDRLIDQIVYQLYGLTAEEIGIVEA